jgi:hypothetical protein
LHSATSGRPVDGWVADPPRQQKPLVFHDELDARLPGHARRLAFLSVGHAVVRLAREKKERQ